MKRELGTQVVERKVGLNVRAISHIFTSKGTPPDVLNGQDAQLM